MFERIVGALLAVLAIDGACAQADGLTPGERRWLAAAKPVLAFARVQAMPLDIIVQPQATPGESPQGMAFVDGRCKLVLSMRGNPQADAALDGVAPELVDTVIEAIAAHELAHCWRHLDRHWGELPGTMVDSSRLDTLPAEQAELLREMWRTRREEGFADLVGLAWTLQRHPEHYAEVHAWHVRLRAKQELDTGPHDTRVWVRLAADRGAFTGAPLIFERVRPLWMAGLLAGS